jgi:exopolysaccharide biosynthesis polyprenyl glycosylphosphotransferase
MHRRQADLFAKGLLVFDVAGSVAAYLITFFLRQQLALAALVADDFPAWLQVPLVTETNSYHLVLLALPPVWAIALYLSGCTQFRGRYAHMFMRYVRAVAIGLAIMVACLFLFKLQTVARSFVVAFGAVNVVFLFLGRVAIMETAAFIRRKQVDGHRVIIVGCGEMGYNFQRSLLADRTFSVKLLGHVCVPGEVKDNRIESPMLGEMAKLDEVLDNDAVDEVVFAIHEVDQELLANALHFCDERGVDVLLPLPPALPARARVEIASVDGFDVPLLGLRRTPSGEARLFFKRLIDLIGVSILFFFSAPIMVLVALAIRLESKGPILFRQTRCGRNGRTFTMLKFRSMVADAEAQKEKLLHLNEMSGPVFKIRRDPRITRVGAFIRKTSLDELPQFFNILLGDMSLVGPRPPIPAEVEQYKPWQRRRLSVKPGLTGLWQVSGRNNIDFEEWMKLDLRYIDEWSLWLDIKILLRTLPAVFSKSGAS